MTAAPPDPSVLAHARAIYRDAARLYRDHLRAIVGSAAVVLVPFALADGAGLLTADTSDRLPIIAVILVMIAVGTSGLSGLASIFYAGYLDHTAEAWRQASPAPMRSHVVRALPWRQLIVASLTVYLFETIGFALFVVPGLIASTLLCLTGPLLVSEGLDARRAIRRSAELVRRQPLLVTITVVIPLVIEGSLADFAGILLGHNLIVEIAFEIVITLFMASFLGIVEVITAHDLQHAYPQNTSADRAGDTPTGNERH